MNAKIDVIQSTYGRHLLNGDAFRVVGFCPDREGCTALLFCPDPLYTSWCLQARLRNVCLPFCLVCRVEWCPLITTTICLFLIHVFFVPKQFTWDRSLWLFPDWFAVSINSCLLSLLHCFFFRKCGMSRVKIWFVSHFDTDINFLSSLVF